MARTNVTIPVSRVAKDIHMTVTVKGLRVMRMRMTVGAWMIRCAARVMGVGSCKVQMESNHTD